MSHVANQRTWRDCSWAVGSAVALTFAALVPGVGVFFGPLAAIAALVVLVVPRYTARQKLIAVACLIASALLTAAQVLLLMTQAI